MKSKTDLGSAYNGFVLPKFHVVRSPISDKIGLRFRSLKNWPGKSTKSSVTRRALLDGVEIRHAGALCGTEVHVIVKIYFRPNQRWRTAPKF